MILIKYRTIITHLWQESVSRGVDTLDQWEYRKIKCRPTQRRNSYCFFDLTGQIKPCSRGTTLSEKVARFIYCIEYLALQRCWFMMVLTRTNSQVLTDNPVMLFFMCFFGVTLQVVFLQLSNVVNVRRTSWSATCASVMQQSCSICAYN